MLDLRTQNTFQGRMDLGEQPADAIGDAGDLIGQVIVVADQHLSLGERVIAGVDAAQRMRQRPGGVGNHIGVTGVGLRGARVQVSEPAHHQAGQMGDLLPAPSSDRNGQRPDRSGLVHHPQDPAVPAEFVEQLAQPSLGVRQRRIMQPLARRVQRDRMMVALADVQAQE